MPTPDGREWLTTERIVSDYQWVRFYDEFKDEPRFDHTGAANDDSPFKQRWCAAVVRGFKATGYDTEFKVCRLTEKLKDAIGRADITDIQEVRNTFQTIYTKEILDQYDEEGELKP